MSEEKTIEQMRKDYASFYDFAATPAYNEQEYPFSVAGVHIGSTEEYMHSKFSSLGKEPQIVPHGTDVNRRSYIYNIEVDDESVCRQFEVKNGIVNACYIDQFMTNAASRVFVLPLKDGKPAVELTLFEKPIDLLAKKQDEFNEAGVFNITNQKNYGYAAHVAFGKDEVEMYSINIDKRSGKKPLPPLDINGLSWGASASDVLRTFGSDNVCFGVANKTDSDAIDWVIVYAFILPDADIAFLSLNGTQRKGLYSFTITYDRNRAVRYGKKAVRDYIAQMAKM